MIPSTSLFDSNGDPSPALLELLEMFAVQHDGTLLGIRDATQAAWLQEGKIRAEIQEKHGDKQKAAWPLFRRLGFVDEVRCRRQRYFHCGVLGATVVAVRKRFALLISEWQCGVRLVNLALVGSHRPLLPDKESREVLLNAVNAELPFRPDWQLQGPLPDTEIEMMRMVYDQAQLSDVWREILNPNRVTCVAPLTANANTRDTLEVWSEDMTSSVLLVSSQPFVSYQRIIAESVMERCRHIDCIGCAANPATSVSVFLDNVAKLIYELAA